MSWDLQVVNKGWQEPWVVMVCGSGEAGEAGFGQIMSSFLVGAQLKSLDFNRKTLGNS